MSTSSLSVPPQSAPLPRATRDRFTEKSSFSCYVARDETNSVSNETLIIKRDDNYDPGHRVAYLGFDISRYIIPGINSIFLNSFTLKIHTRTRNGGTLSVFLVTNHSFWNTTFKFSQRPTTGKKLGTLNIDDADENGWLTLNINPSLLGALDATGGKLSFVLGGDPALRFHEISSSSAPGLEPTLDIAVGAGNIEPSESIRYLTVAALRTESGQAIEFADLQIINASGGIEDRAAWRVIAATNITGWENMLDGSEETAWIIREGVPVYFTIDFNKVVDVRAVTYAARKIVINSRALDFLLYGSRDADRWRLIGSRGTPSGLGPVPRVIFTGIHSGARHLETTVTIPVTPPFGAEKDRLKNSGGRSQLELTSICFRTKGMIIVWVDNTQPADDIYLMEGHWTRSTRHRLSSGFNSFEVGPQAAEEDPDLELNDQTYLSAYSSAVEVPTREITIRIMAENADYYPVFVLNRHTQSDWLRMLDLYGGTSVLAIRSRRFILSLSMAHFLPFKDETNIETIARDYDELLIPTELAEGIIPDAKSGIHRPDANPYLFLPNTSTYMSSGVGRMQYNPDLTRRMLKEARTFWGIWHEVGHQLQLPTMNWSGQTEVSVNIYAFAARAYNTPVAELAQLYNPIFTTAFSALESTQSYNDLPFATKEILFHHLFFLFGEKFMHILHQRYRAKLHNPQHDPAFEFADDNDNTGKMNVLAILCSRAATRNLVTFFQFWRFPLTSATIITINNFGYPALENFERLPSILVENRDPSDFDMRF